MMIDPEKIALILSELEDIKASGNDPVENEAALYRLFSLFFEYLTEDRSIGFTTLFSRMSFVIQKYNLPGHLSYGLHYFRRTMEGDSNRSDHSEMLELGSYLIRELSHRLVPSLSLARPEKIDVKKTEDQQQTEFSRVMRVVISGPGEKAGTFYVIPEKTAPDKRLAVFGEVMAARQITHALKCMPSPLEVNLVDVALSNEVLYPKACVIMPDFLVGVTSVSECFQQKSSFALSYLVHKLVPTQSNIPMLIGNVVNYFFDELVHEPDKSFDQLIKNCFGLAPEVFATMSDGDVKNFLDKTRLHFDHLKEVVGHELSENDINKETSYLEPTFYSGDYGLYGRLDLYQHEPQTKQSNIVELKSGKLFRPNAYDINQNHFVQTLLYDLVIESVYSGRVKTQCYILYSGLKTGRLKPAPRLRDLQREALLVRNDIILIEHILSRVSEPQFHYILDAVNPDKIPEGFTFVQRDARRFYEAFSALDAFEKEYIRHFIAFLSREYLLSKVGEHGVFRSNGLASLWLDSLDEKIEQFTIISQLEIRENAADQADPLVRLGFTTESNRVSKFRQGDIVVMYPHQDSGRPVLQHQIFKCTIISLDNEEILVRLRSRQKNFEAFRQFPRWNLEPDSLDSGFNKQFQGLYDFARASKRYRALLYGNEAPGKSGDATHYSDAKLTDEQARLINSAINAKDYYLLWGPPGTGKTSVMIRHLTRYYYEHTDQNILLMAYTNRAVDEICDAIASFAGDHFIRIGSRYATSASYQENLLSHITNTHDSRSALVGKLNQTRIFVSTVSSFQGKKDLVRLKTFDLVIIDEASQLLEPMLCGMLQYFQKFILIGDHKQLPAVVAQNEQLSKIKDDVLREKTGLTDCRISLFERMFLNCTRREWTWAYGTLTRQGRMHRDILDFVNPRFYENRLGLLTFIDRLEGPFPFEGQDPVLQSLAQNRLIFIDIPDNSEGGHKVNPKEALLVLEIVRLWKEIYRTMNIEFDNKSIGVISPFRAQIAHIKALEKNSVLEDVTVDTIERYQGGARNQIIISLAVHRTDLLDSISNVSEEGLDRKLNVALTRAKEHIIIIGNSKILSHNKSYRDLIDACICLDVSKFL